MEKLFTHIAKIIETAAKSPLGIFALMIVSMSLLGFVFFREASEMMRAGIFVLMFLGVCVFGFAAVRSLAGQQQRSDNTHPEPSEAGKVVTLRRKPAMVSVDQVKVSLSRLDFYEKRWNPGAKGVAHRFQSEIHDDALVLTDGATSLMWQKGGSEPMTYDKAQAYVARLNAERFAGFNDWRLPTMEEAMSLMEPHAQDHFHINPLFEQGIHFIWTADHATNGGVWLLYFYDGILAAEREAFNAWTKAVRCM